MQTPSLRQTNFFQAIQKNFKATYGQTFKNAYGFWRDVVDRVVQKFLKCGDLAKGFARIGACGYGNELLLTFSCKCRNWSGSLRARSCRRFAPRNCPSCHQKKVLLFGEKVRDEIVYPVPHRQYVFTITKRLRCYFRNNRKLLGQLCLAARDSLKNFLRDQLCLPDGEVGMILVIHTFGEYLGWHTHLHLTVCRWIVSCKWSISLHATNKPRATGVTVS